MQSRGVSSSGRAWWLGLIDDSVAAGEQVYRAHLGEGGTCPAAMAALGVALNLLLRGDEPTGLDWIGRCHRLLDGEPEGVEHGYLLFLTTVLGPLDSLGFADEHAVKELITNARAVGDLGRAHFGPTLVALGTLGERRYCRLVSTSGDDPAHREVHRASRRLPGTPPPWS